MKAEENTLASSRNRHQQSDSIEQRLGSRPRWSLCSYGVPSFANQVLTFRLLWLGELANSDAKIRVANELSHRGATSVSSLVPKKAIYINDFESIFSSM